MYDFVIGYRNDGGEAYITAQTERARGRLNKGQTLVFRSWGDAIPYIDAAEAEGLTFFGKELLPL